MAAAQQFIEKIDAFLAETGMSPSLFGRLAVGDPNFVGDLHAGRMPSLRLVERVDEFIEAARVQRSGESARVAS